MPKRAVLFDLEPEHLEILKALADEAGVSRAEIVRRAIEAYAAAQAKPQEGEE